MLSSLPQEEGPAKSPIAQVWHWASCHPGILIVGSLAVAALLARPRPTEPEIPERQPETEADLLDGEDPLFI